MEKEPVTLTQSEWRVMDALWAGPKTLMELVRQLGDSAGWAKSTVTTMVRRMEEKGLVISGTSPDGRLVETVELPGRAFHLGAQFHPEFKSRPNRAHPLFKGFIAAALKFRASEQRSLLHM